MAMARLWLWWESASRTPLSASPALHECCTLPCVSVPLTLPQFPGAGPSLAGGRDAVMEPVGVHASRTPHIAVSTIPITFPMAWPIFLFNPPFRACQFNSPLICILLPGVEGAASAVLSHTVIRNPPDKG